MLLLYVGVVSFGMAKCMLGSKCHFSIEIIDEVEFNVAKTPKHIYLGNIDYKRDVEQHFVCLVPCGTCLHVAICDDDMPSLLGSLLSREYHVAT